MNEHQDAGAQRGQSGGHDGGQQGGQTGERLRDFADTAKEQAQAGAAAVISGMRNLASSLRDSMPHEGMMGTAASAVADTLERGGSYLQDEGLSGLVDDLTTLVRRNPLPAVCISLGVGFLVAQLCRSER